MMAPAETGRAREGVAAICAAARDVRGFVAAIPARATARVDALASLGLLYFRLGLYARDLGAHTLAQGVALAARFEERIATELRS